MVPHADLVAVVRGDARARGTKRLRGRANLTAPLVQVAAVVCDAAPRTDAAGPVTREVVKRGACEVVAHGRARGVIAAFADGAAPGRAHVGGVGGL